MSLRELLSAVGYAKSRVDAGFSRVGRGLSPDDPAAKALTILAARALAQGNAVMALCERGLANEALPLLRGLAEASLAMRWVAAGDCAPRAQQALEELRAADWETHWPSARLRERAAAFDVPPKMVEFVLGSAAEFARGAAQGLPWAHVFADAALPGRGPEQVLPAAAVLLGHALKALDTRWPGQFTGAEQMWWRAGLSRGQRQ